MNFDVFETVVKAEFPFISEGQIEQFRAMDGLYRDWNSKINVISRKDIDGFYEHHVLHSLAIAAYWCRCARGSGDVLRCVGDSGDVLRAETAPQACSASRSGAASQADFSSKSESASQADLSSKSDSASRADLPSRSGAAPQASVSDLGTGGGGRPQRTVLDLGTGGGFPGIPLAVMFPEIQFTLCDSIGKKVKVAGEVAAALGLANVTTVNARAESLPEVFDFVVSRAVTSLDNFYPWVKDRFRGSIYYLKGGDVNEEICRLMSIFKLKKGSVSTWRVDNWLTDEYFQEKFVIKIEKDYLCSPIVENIKI